MGEQYEPDIVNAAEAFLHDCDTGESDFCEELFNVIGYNEFRQLVRHARFGKDMLEKLLEIKGNEQ